MDETGDTKISGIAVALLESRVVGILSRFEKAEPRAGLAPGRGAAPDFSAIVDIQLSDAGKPSADAIV